MPLACGEYVGGIGTTGRTGFKVTGLQPVAFRTRLLWPKPECQRSLSWMVQLTPEKTNRWPWNASPRSAFAPALGGSLLCWLAFPPVGWSLLAWVAPIAWLLLVRLKELPGRRPYRALWLAGSLFWLLTVHWIRLPHPMNYLAWLVLASYLGIYLPTFVALARGGVHRWGLPLWLVAPVVWTGLDWLRNHVMTGFGMGSLAHTQVEFPAVIQIADLVGEYGVTFLIVLVASCLTSFLLDREPWFTRSRLLQLLPAAILLLATLMYGRWQGVEMAFRYKAPLGARIALIQGNTLADWKSNPDRQTQIMAEYLQLSHDALRQSLERDGRKVDLVVWPETSFRQTLITTKEGYEPPTERVHESMLLAAQKSLAELVRQLQTAVLVGIDRAYLFPDETGELNFQLFNSSVLVDAHGKILGTYDKMHRVPFGEYIPFAEWFPALYRMTPLTGGIQAGQNPATNLGIENVLFAPNICYETAVPHLLRRQVCSLVELRGTLPDVMINLTNDAWYWGSSELDMHLACGVFRAVEMRIPLVIAANGGLSAHVSRYGQVLQVTERQKTETLLVDLPLLGDRPGYLSLYAQWGDWFAIACVLCCMVLAVSGRVAARRIRALAAD